MEVRQYEFSKVSALASPYMAYRALVRKKISEPMGDSRCDAMTALWMQAAGYTAFEVADEMFKTARPLRKEREHRDWKTYARRLEQYSFGAHDDILPGAYILEQY
jgi:hypothetical protein